MNVQDKAHVFTTFFIFIMFFMVLLITKILYANSYENQSLEVKYFENLSEKLPESNEKETEYIPAIKTYICDNISEKNKSG